MPEKPGKSKATESSQGRAQSWRRPSRVLKFVPDQYKTPEMCEKAVEEDPWLLKFVPDQYKT